jgi:hypothetical protein
MLKIFIFLFYRRQSATCWLFLKKFATQSRPAAPQIISHQREGLTSLELLSVKAPRNYWEHLIRAAVSYLAKFRLLLRQGYKQDLLTTDLFRVVDEGLKLTPGKNSRHCFGHFGYSPGCAARKF